MTDPKVKAECAIGDCARPAAARGWCSMHYKRWQAHGDPEKTRHGQTKTPCSVDGCEKPRHANGYCGMHNMRTYMHGDPNVRLRASNDAPCSVDGCEEWSRKAGMCGQHYNQLRRTGRTWPIKRRTVADECATCKGPTVHRFCSNKCRVHFVRHGGQPPVAAKCRACGVEVALLEREGRNRLRADVAFCLDCGRRRSDQQRKDRVKKATIERVDRAVVWQRDQGMCGLCGLPANPDRWDLDHVLPLARGGDHSYANTQVSHPRCNRRKGARIATA